MQKSSSRTNKPAALEWEREAMVEVGLREAMLSRPSVGAVRPLSIDELPRRIMRPMGRLGLMIRIGIYVCGGKKKKKKAG